MRPFSWDYAGTSGRAAPSKRITRSDAVVCKLLENVLCEVGRPWEQPLPKAVSDNRGPGKPERSPPCVIPMYSGLGRSSAAIFYSLYGNSRFSLESTDAERRGALRKCVYLATRSSNTLNGSSNLVYDFSCFMCVGCMK